MATRLYVGSKAPGTNLTGPPLGTWTAGDSTRDNRGDPHWTFELGASKTDCGVNVTAVAFGTSLTKANGQSILGYRWVTPTLGAITLSGTFQMCLMASHGSGTGDLAAYKIYAYISQGDTLTQRTVLIDNVVDATQLPTLATNTSLTAALAVAGSVLAGDRIVIEVGAVCSPATSPVGDNNFFLRYGTTTSAYVDLADATAGSTSVLATWMEFSDTIVPQAAVAAPANDACADAVVIASAPYTSPRINTTQSADTSRAVWYSYTAQTSGRYFVSTMGSNYSTRVDVYSGGCGVLTPVFSDQKIAWIGTGQTVAYWTATSGTTYHLKVTNYNVVTGANSTVSARNSGGSLVLSVYPYSAPQTDDLVVNGQHIAVIRNGQIVNNSDLFYGNTPTAAAIDYTLRPMTSLNGGTVSARRIYVGLFGASPLVEILDLDTLNVGVGLTEIDYVLDSIAAGGQNVSSLVFNKTSTGGSIYIGWYGNNYSVAGGTPSSTASTSIRYFIATRADNQTGAPWPAASSWPVVLENQGSDFIDLAADQVTMYYTSSGTLIKSINISTGVQGANLATVANASGPRPGLRGLRTLPPGDGTNGWLVTAGSVAYWIGPLGTILQTYTPSPAVYDLDKLEITSDGSTFWMSDQYSTNLYHFNIATGAQLSSVALNFPPGQLCGFAIVGGYRSGTGTDGAGATPATVAAASSTEIGYATTLPIRWVLRTGVIT